MGAMEKFMFPSKATLGERIRAARKFRGLSQSELAARIGIKSPSLSEIETGQTKSLKGATLAKMAEVLDFSPEWINSGRGSPTRIDAVAIEEAELVHIYRALSEPLQVGLMATARAMLDQVPSTSATKPFHKAKVKSGQ